MYFCSLEALQNVAKYATAERTVIAWHVQRRLTFAVTTTARVRPTPTGYGTGLQGMADRLDAVGGSWRSVRRPGREPRWRVTCR